MLNFSVVKKRVNMFMLSELELEFLYFIIKIGLVILAVYFLTKD